MDDTPPTTAQRVVYFLFATLLAGQLILSPVVARAMTDFAALMLLLSLALGWRGFRLLSPAAWLLYGGFLLYFLAAPLSLLNNQDWGFAGWRFERYYPFLLIVFTMGLLAWLRRSLVPVLVWASLATALVMAVYAGYEVQVLGYERAGLEEGAFGLFGLYVNNFGHVAFFHAVILLSAALLAQRTGLRLLFLAGGLLAFYAGFASGTRGALLGFVAALLAMTGALAMAAGPLRRTARQALVALLVFLVVGGLLFGHSDFWRQYVHDGITQFAAFWAGDTRFTPVGGRLLMWKGAAMIWHDHPLIGTGIGDGQADMEALIASGRLAWQGREPFPTMHNIYMEAVATTGAVGLATLLLGIFILPARHFLRSLLETTEDDLWGRVAALAGLGTLALHAVFGLTQSWLSLRALPLLLVTLVVLLAGTPAFRRADRGG